MAELANGVLVKLLRCEGKTEEECRSDKCPYIGADGWCDESRMLRDAADALETEEKRIDGLQKLVNINTKRCEALRKQLRQSHASYEKHLKELEAQLPKEGEWIPGKELSREYVGNCCVEIIYENFRCSACGVIIEEHKKPKWKHCTNCGARMRKNGEQFENDPVMKDIKDGRGIKPIITDGKNGLLHIE